MMCIRRFTALMFTLLSMCFLSGCLATLEPNEWELRFTSIPSGALVYAAKSGKAIGITPMSRLLYLNPQRQQLDKMDDEILIVWPSGATLRQKVSFAPKENRIWTWSFSRPPSAPGLDIDLLQAELQTQTIKSDDSMATLLSTFVSSYAAGRQQALPQSFTPPTAIRCTSRTVGWGVVTDCQ